MTRPVALVTGASRGVGLAIARELSRTHQVLAGASTQASLAELLQAIPDAVPFVADLSDESALAHALQAANLSRLDVLVHSAGIADERPFQEFSRDDWRRSFEVNLFAVADLTARLLPALRSARGLVAFINSGSGFMSYPRGAVYTGTKFALRTLADCLREEERAFGVRVTSIHPGFVDTDMGRRLRGEAGRAGGADTYIPAWTVAAAVRQALDASPVAQLESITLRPLVRA